MKYTNAHGSALSLLGFILAVVSVLGGFYHALSLQPGALEAVSKALNSVP